MTLTAIPVGSVIREIITNQNDSIVPAQIRQQHIEIAVWGSLIPTAHVFFSSLDRIS